MSFKHKLAAGLAALGLLASLTGCTLGKSFDYAAKVGEVEISSGLYLYYQYASYLDAAEQSQKNPKEVKTVLKEQIGEQSATDYIRDQTKARCISYAAMENLFDKEGLEVTEEDEAQIEANVNQNWDSQKKALEKNGIGKDTYRTLVRSALKSSKLFDHYYGADGLTPVGDDELKAYFESQYLHISFLALPKLNSESNAISSDGIATINDLSEQMLAKLKGGATMKEVADEFMPQVLEVGGHSFAEGTDFVQQDFINKDTENYSTYPMNMINQIKADGVGDYNRYEAAQYTFVYQRQSALANEADFASARTSLLVEMKEGEFSEKSKAAEEGLEIVYNDAAVKEFSPKKIKYVAS